MMQRGACGRVVLVAFGVLTLAGPFTWAADKPLFDYRDLTLANGLRVITLEDSSCPVVSVQLWYHVGSKDERQDRQGFAHMFEHMMFRGTDRLGKTEHFDLIHHCGGTCNAYTAFDQTVYHETVPSNQLELALWLEAERMGFLRINQDAFDTERKVVEEERRLGLNRPYGTLPERILAEVFKTHPYGWTPIGKISHLRASSTQDLRDFWNRYYVPDNATLVIVGDIKHVEAQRLAKKYFGWMPREAEPPRVTLREPPVLKARAITIREDNAPAPVVLAGWRVVPSRHDDAIPLELLASIVGGGESSRLYRNLVADQQLAVLALAMSASLEQEGFWGAAAVMQPLGNPRKALEALQKEIERVRTEPVSEQELTKAKNRYLAGQITQTLSVDSRARALGSAAVLEGDPARVNKQLELARRVTTADLLRVAKKYLAPEHCLTFTVEGNLLGTIFGGKSAELKKEENAPITAKPETTPPPPGRPGLRRPADYPAQPPITPTTASRFATPHSEHTLANGLKVLVVPKHGVPYVSVELGLQAGAWTETKPGTTSLVLGMLTRGTQAHTEKQLAEELETYAIDLSGSAGMDTSAVSAGCLTEHVDRAIKLLAEVVRTPTFPAKEFEKLRTQRLTGLAISTAEPAYKAERELRRRLFGSHPYGRTASGEVKDLKALKVDDLSHWWSTFARPDQAVLIFAGDIDAPRALNLAESAFGSWKTNGPKPVVTLPELPAPAPRHIYLVDYPSGVQSQIRVGQLGIKRDHPEYPAARLVTEYFGGAFGSRLNEVIRVQKGLTYGARGGYEPSRFAGQFVINTFSKTESTAEAVRAVFEEIDRLRKEPPSAKELESAKSYFAGSFALQRETPQAVAADLWLLEATGLPLDFNERVLTRVAQTDAAACMRLVRTALDPTKIVVVVVGNAARIRQDLEKIAPVTLVKE
jgi:zinc protease